MITLPANFRTLKKIKNLLETLPYQSEDSLYQDKDDYLLLSFTSEYYTPLLGLASVLNHYPANKYPKTTLEILGGMGLYSADLANRYPYCQCYVSDSNKDIIDIGKKINPHLSFIEPTKIFNPHSLDVVFTSSNYVIQSSPIELLNIFDITSNLLATDGFMLCEVTNLFNAFNISSSFYNINGRVRYKGKQVLLLSMCLDYNPITGLYVIGHSIWSKETETPVLIKAFKIPYYLNPLHHIKQIAEACDLNTVIYSYSIPVRKNTYADVLYADQIEFVQLSETSSYNENNLLLKFSHKINR